MAYRYTDSGGCNDLRVRFTVSDSTDIDRIMLSCLPLELCLISLNTAIFPFSII